MIQLWQWTWGMAILTIICCIALRVLVTVQLVLKLARNWTVLMLSRSETLALWLKRRGSACQVVLPVMWWGMGLPHLLQGYKTGLFPYLSLNLASVLHCVLEWWPALLLISEGWFGQASFWTWSPSVAFHYSPDRAGTICSSVLTSKWLSRAFKAVLTMVSSYLHGTDVVNNFNPVLKFWGLSWRYYSFFFFFFLLSLKSLLLMIARDFL